MLCRRILSLATTLRDILMENKTQDLFDPRTQLTVQRECLQTPARIGLAELVQMILKVMLKSIHLPRPVRTTVYFEEPIPA
jgi:hypothetical protein